VAVDNTTQVQRFTMKKKIRPQQRIDIKIYKKINKSNATGIKMTT